MSTEVASHEPTAAAAASYNVYEGTLGRYGSHRGDLGCNRPATADGSGRRELSYDSAGSSYFIVTASGCAVEGPSDPDHPLALANCAP